MRKYQTQQGENRTVYEVVADNVQFLGDRGGGKQEKPEEQPEEDPGEPWPPKTPEPQEPAPTDDDLPF